MTDPLDRAETTDDESGAHRPPLDIGQAAAYLGVDVRWMRRAVLERRLPYYKLGRHLRFRLEDLEELMRTSRVEPGPVRAQGPSERVS